MGQRIVSFVLAFLIFASAVASGFFVIQAIRQEQKTSTDTAAVDTTTNTQSNNTSTEATGENALKGKPLADFSATTERVSEVQVIDMVEGTGDVVQAGDTITAHYTGARAADGIVFESSKDSGQPLNIPLSNLIKGWQTGIPGMKVGGTRRLIIPAAQAYGDDPSTGRPTGDLVFDIEMIATTR